MTAHPTSPRTASPSRQSPRHTMVRGLAVLAAATATLVIWLVAGPVAGLDLLVEMTPGATPQPVGPVAVTLASLLAGLAGWGLMGLLERFTRRSGVIWTVLALVVLLLSLLGPLGAAEAATKAVLMSMHVVAAAILIPALGRTATARRA